MFVGSPWAQATTLTRAPTWRSACSSTENAKSTANVFIGEYQHSIAPKGRLAVPAKFRAILSTAKSKGAVVTRGLDQSLFLYPGDEWQRLAVLFGHHEFGYLLPDRRNRRGRGRPVIPAIPAVALPLPVAAPALARVKGPE